MSFFKYSEFECPCCSYNATSRILIEKLDTARRLAGVPFVITSGSRCTKHNKEVGGSPTSSHIKGLAVDIKATDSKTRYKVLKGLSLAGFDRVGIAKNFIHVDIDTDKASEVTWVYS